jgi:hypothetical protein
MLEQLRKALSTSAWHEGDTPPAVDYVLFFDGNTDEESIATNQWGDGRPAIADIYKRVQEIAKRSDVERILVGLHFDWDHEHYADSFPPAENVHIFTTASTSEVESWLTDMHTDGVIKGWPYGKPKNAPEPSNGYGVLSVCWD